MPSKKRHLRRLPVACFRRFKSGTCKFFLLMRLRNFRHNIFHALLVANSPLNSKCTANQYLHWFQQFSFLLNHTSVSHYSHFYFRRENDILHSTQGVLYRNDTSVMQSLFLKEAFYRNLFQLTEKGFSFILLCG